MNSVRRLFVAALAAAAFVSTGAIAADANVAGEWDLSVETGNGTGTPHMSLKQQGNAVTGMYKSATFGEAPITGTVKGNEVTLNIKVSGQGQEMTIVYTGTVDGASMKGKVSLGELGEGTFTGKKA
jgi:hypothetical protein